MKRVLVLGANGQVARIVESRILQEQADVKLTLFLRNSSRLDSLKNNENVTIVDGDVTNFNDVNSAMKGQDLVYISMVDHTSDNIITNNVVKAIRANKVSRIVATNLLGIYNEVPGEFGRWNYSMVKSGLPAAINADKILSESGLTYTTLRFPWLNDRDEVKYSITHKDEEYVGVSGSRQSMADVIVKIISDSKYLANDSVGIADPNTQGKDRPVY
ncbi:NAD(P)H-binding protein [Companilactobacillus halodurans]|uniref:Oxidoreductase n=1 Tax=Companilactobacillus halodurans TaxID=2584183 RepID=A0A5P0ZQ48_9LACO|nr:NAD(P)H-binding protein [Companilactobacillus halodurans]MQS76195.1 oxidoreductase [Companilactobacillus halodurans]MQS97423.1 oxidoreductase [Companilactobacillus halodurans]